MITPADKLVIAVGDEVEQAGGAAVLLKYLLNPVLLKYPLNPSSVNRSAEKINAI